MDSLLLIPLNPPPFPGAGVVFVDLETHVIWGTFF